jgi:hypothetical protein
MQLEEWSFQDAISIFGEDNTNIFNNDDIEMSDLLDSSLDEYSYPTVFAVDSLFCQDYIEQDIGIGFP